MLLHPANITVSLVEFLYSITETISWGLYQDAAINDFKHAHIPLKNNNGELNR